MPVTISLATPADVGSLKQLLRGSGLPSRDLGLYRETVVLAARSGTSVVGGAALERYGSSGLLRSVVVAGGHRSQGIGRMLVARALDEAHRSGVTAVYLLTETATRYFSSLGFRAVDRSRVPPAVRASTEFAVHCPDGAAVMRSGVRTASQEASTRSPKAST